MPAFVIKLPKKKNVIFFHVPKCAGTAIRTGFFGDSPKKVYESYKKSWNNIFKFTFIRNPYERIISAWKMLTIGLHKTITKDSLKEDLTLEEFLEIVFDKKIDFKQKDWVKEKGGKKRLRWSYKQIVKRHTLPISHPFYMVDKANFIGRVENFEEDFKKVCNLIKIKYRRVEKTHIAVPEQNHIDYFSKDLLKKVSKYYAEDFERYGYARLDG